MTKIRSGDLRHPPFFYLYSCSDWKRKPGETVPFKYLYFSIREETGGEILTVIFRRSAKGKAMDPRAVFPISAWGYTTQARIMRRLFEQMYPGSPFGAFRRLVRALWLLKVPRFHLDPESIRFIPWKYRNVSKEFIQAQSLVSI